VSRGEQARRAILDAAERLIAQQGVRVPLRDIALAAGQRNNSAVNYYFRSRQELIDAIVRRRLEPMEEQRRVMLDAVDANARMDVDVLLRAMVFPLLSVDSAYYARFLQAAALHLRTDADQTPDSVWPHVMEGLARAVPTSEHGARHRRVAAVATTMFALLADHEHRVQTDPRAAGTGDEIVAMLAAMLTAPVPVGALSRQSSGTP
jgi:AcrR family transcriptional regulator